MGNVTLVDYFVYFIHSIRYFAGLFSELSFLALSAFISRIAGFGLPAGIFVSILIIGGTLLILYPFQRRYDTHEFHSNANAHLYEALQSHLYRHRPPIIGDNYSREIGGKKIEEDMAILEITYDSTITENNEGTSEITECLTDSEPLNESSKPENVRLNEIIAKETIQEAKNEDILNDNEVTDSNILATVEATEIQPIEIHNETINVIESTEHQDLESFDQIKQIEVPNITSLLINDIIATNSNSSDEINSTRRDTIERIEKVMSVIEPDLIGENVNDLLDNVNSREPSEQVEEILSIINNSDVE